MVEKFRSKMSKPGFSRVKFGDFDKYERMAKECIRVSGAIIPKDINGIWIPAGDWSTKGGNRRVPVWKHSDRNDYMLSRNGISSMTRDFFQYDHYNNPLNLAGSMSMRARKKLEPP